MRPRLKCAAVALFVGLFSLAASAPGEMIVLHGGRTGRVAFPHLRHHEALEKDCRACHDLFPQEAGAIDKLKREGKLKKRQVMTSCVNCHKKMIRLKTKAGPVKCRGCHEKVKR